MNILELRDFIIDRGIKSVKAEYAPETPEYQGGLEGFELCRSYLTAEDFLNALSLRSREEQLLLDAAHDDEAGLHAYWRHRYATLQIDFVWERLKIAFGLPGPYSGRAFMDLAGIVGVSPE